jgi:hypothetical protein
VNSTINNRNYNDAKSGAKAADMVGQAQTAVSQNVEYVMLIGANDCTSSESTMTSVAHSGSIDSATPGAGCPPGCSNSIPTSALEVGGHFQPAPLVLFGICKSMLANPTSTATTDVQRRDRVRQRVVDFNTQLAQACAAYGANCKFDNNAVFNYPFVLSQVSTWDYFHPNTSGQAVLANVSYANGFGW